MKKLMISAFVLLMAGCMQAPQTDLEGLKAMRDVWQSAFDARDSAALAAIYAEDGALMPPNSDTLIGRAAIEAFWADFQASGIGGEIKDTEAYAHGDVGYKVGTYTISDADGATVDEGKYVEIWRYIDGTWQMHRDIFNSNLPLSAPESEADSKQKTLYQRLGGYDVVAAILDNWGPRVFDDPELSLFLADIDEEMGTKGRELALDLLCDLTGGPCVYTGRDVKMVHTRVGITDEHWQSVLEYMEQTLDELNIADDEKTDFIAIIASLGGT
ncbi:MAG: DUF4440 domain-containing protein [Woeseia sp.]